MIFVVSDSWKHLDEYNVFLGVTGVLNTQWSLSVYFFYHIITFNSILYSYSGGKENSFFIFIK